jgi:hypothetical protein
VQLPSVPRAYRWAPFWLIAALLVVVLIAFLPEWSGRYLYASSLVFVGCFVGFMHSLALGGVKWSDPWEARDDQERANGRADARDFLAVVGVAGALVGVVWAASHRAGPDFLRSGGWYLFYVAVFAPFLWFTRRRLAYVNFRAAFATVLAMDLILSSYEYLLLKEGTGWEYRNTVVWHVFVVPLENVLFIYPVAAALVCVLYTVATRHLNNLKAFWFLMGGLTCVFVPVEIVGIGWLDLWTVEPFAEKSIWVIGNTNIEEFVYYLLFQALAGLIYIWFDHNLVPASAEPPA